MRYLLLLVVVAGAYFGWKKYSDADAPPPPADVVDPNTTPAGNAANRMDNLTGAAPMP